MVCKLLTYPEELGSLMTHSEAEFGRGRSKPVGQILSISTPSLPLCPAGWKHIPGIIYCERMDPVVPRPTSSDQEGHICCNFFRQHLVVDLL